jgi:hypothetical protein
LPIADRAEAPTNHVQLLGPAEAGEGGSLYAGRVVPISNRARKNRTPAFREFSIRPLPGSLRVAMEYNVCVVRHDRASLYSDGKAVPALENATFNRPSLMFEVLF